MVVGSDGKGEIKKMEDINEDVAEGQGGMRWGAGEKPRKGWGYFLQTPLALPSVTASFSEYLLNGVFSEAHSRFLGIHFCLFPQKTLGYIMRVDTGLILLLYSSVCLRMEAHPGVYVGASTLAPQKAAQRD